MIRYENVMQIKFDLKDGVEIYADIGAKMQDGKYNVDFYISIKEIMIKFFIFDLQVEAQDGGIKKAISLLVENKLAAGEFDNYLKEYKERVAYKEES